MLAPKVESNDVSNGRITLFAIVAIALMVGFIYLLVQQVGYLRSLSDLDERVSVSLNGFVFVIDAHHHHGSKGRAMQTTYEIEGNYSYEYNGLPYEGHRIYLFKREFHTRREAEQSAKALKHAGLAWLHPERPNDPVLSKEPKSRTKAIMDLLKMIFLLIGSVVLCWRITATLRWRADRSREAALPQAL